MKRLAALFALVSVVATANPTPPLDEILSRLSFTPLNANPVDFKVPDLNGEQYTLESLKGKWTFLTFWATWCGACAKELPELQKLHVAFGLKGLNIVAVSSDSEPTNVVQKYIEDAHYNFIVLHDQSGEMAQNYQANAIPITYLVSPNLRIAGVVRGAVLNWSQQMDMVEALLTYKDFAVSDKDQGISLNLKAPVITLQIPEGALAIKTIHELRVNVQWEGDSSLYLIKVPTIKIPEGVSLGPVSSQSSSNMGASSLDYVFPLQAETPGSYIIGPVELAYHHRMGGQDQFTRLAEKEMIFVRNGPALEWIFGICALVTATLMGAFSLKKRREKRLSLALAAEKTEILKAKNRKDFEALMRLKIDGKKREYALGLLALIVKMTPHRQEELKLLVTEISYGGREPSDAQLRAFEKEAEATLAL